MMKIKLLFIAIVLILLFSSGCGLLCDNFGIFCEAPLVNKPEFNIKEDIKNAQITIKNSTTAIEKASQEISIEANKINQEISEVPTGVKSGIASHLNIIKKSSTTIIKGTTKINKATAKLSSAQSLLENAGQKIEVTEGVLDIVIKERDSALVAQKRAEEEKDSQMQKMLQWLIISCIIGAGICVVAFFMFGNKNGLIGAGACVLVLTLASFVQAYFIYLAIIGGCLLLLLLVGLIWNIMVQKKAFSQVIDTVEIVKNNLTEDKKTELFGKEGETGKMNSIQSQSTQSMVKKEKEKMTLWNSIKNNL